MNERETKVYLQLDEVRPSSNLINLTEATPESEESMPIGSLEKSNQIKSNLSQHTGLL